MSFTRVTWVNGTTPFIDAINLNRMDAGILSANMKAGEGVAVTGTGGTMVYTKSEYVIASGDVIVIVLSAARSGTMTLNVNTGGALAVVDTEGNTITGIPEGTWAVRYTGSNYKLLGVVISQAILDAAITKLGNVESNADVTDAVNVGSSMTGVTAVAIADADTMPLNDASDTNLLKKITWANIKATLKTYLDSLTTTFTNKRITKRTQSTASTATLAANSDNYDIVKVTAQAAAISISSPTGTPTDEQPLQYIIKDNGTARAITWGSAFAAGDDIELPLTTVAGKWLRCGFIYNTTAVKWQLWAFVDNM